MSDLISRENLELDMYEACFAEDYYFQRGMQKWDGGNWIRYKVFEEILAKQPSAEKTGKWRIEKLNQSRYLVRCSVCGKEYVDEYDSYIDASKFNYCPNCGARMVNENEK